jgi:GYF domain 2
MYKIIGANQVEYGPVSADQVRQWIAEGRINAQTSAQAVGDTAWKPIAAFSEFATHFPSNATPPPLSSPLPPPPPPPLGTYAPSGDGLARALSEVNGPAIGLMVTAILGAFAALTRIVINLFAVPMTAFTNFQGMPAQSAEMMRVMQSFSGTVGIIFAVLEIGLAVFIFFGALKMKALQNHTFCIVTAIVALIPCVSPCCCVGLPIGIWALIVMNKPEVRAYFS